MLWNNDMEDTQFTFPPINWDDLKQGPGDYIFKPANTEKSA